MENKTDIKRRSFLRTVTVGTAGAAAAVVAGKAVLDETPVAADSSDKRGKGYRVTEHINNYYRTTRV